MPRTIRSRARTRRGPVQPAGRGGVLLALMAIAVGAAWLPMPGPLVDRIFSTGWYPLVQPALTSVSGLTSFALLDVLLLAGAFLLGLRIVRALRAPRGWRRWLHLGRDIAAATALVYLIFLVVWGLNYRRTPLQARLDFDPARITPAAVESAATRAVEVLNRLDPVVRAVPESAASLPSLRVSLAPAFSQAQRSLGADDLARPGRPKTTLLAPFFRWATVDGMMNPFGLEVLINPDVLPVERPFVLAHEWGHLAGWAREDDASYVGWLTCLNGDAFARYSGWLSLYLHLRRELGPETRAALDARLAAGPRADLRAIADRLQRAAPLVQSVSWLAYDQYLRANRSAEGVRSYHGIVALVLGTDTDADGRPKVR